MKHKTKQRLVRDYARRFKRRKIEQLEGMGVVEFIKQHHSFKLSPQQQSMVEAITSNKHLTITRHRAYGKTWFYRELKKAFDSGVVGLRPQLVTGNQADQLYADLLEAKRKEWDKQSPVFEAYKNGDWGVDMAQRKDESVIFKSLPKEEEE